MAAKLDPSEIVTFKELYLANSIQINTAIQLIFAPSLIVTFSTLEKFLANK